MRYSTPVQVNGRRLRQIRGERSLSDVAAAVGATKQMLWNWENGGGMSGRWLATLLLYYGVSAKDVVTVEPLVEATANEQEFFAELRREVNTALDRNTLEML